ncbi:MAG: peptidase M28, partial [Bacteroidia bacterium]|nr:peptidase M28 [Bacteroidia bacterium]
MRTYIISFLILFLAFATVAQQPVKIEPANLEKHVEFLASDSLKGRKPGTPEAGVAARYILENFMMAGLTPIADNGFQYFNVVTGVK